MWPGALVLSWDRSGGARDLQSTGLGVPANQPCRPRKQRWGEQRRHGSLHSACRHAAIEAERHAATARWHSASPRLELRSLTRQRRSLRHASGGRSQACVKHVKQTWFSPTLRPRRRTYLSSLLNPGRMQSRPWSGRSSFSRLRLGRAGRPKRLQHRQPMTSQGVSLELARRLDPQRTSSDDGKGVSLVRGDAPVPSRPPKCADK